MLLVLPILVPFLAAALSVVVWRLRLQRVVALLGTGGLFASGVAVLAVVRQEGIQTLQLGNWPAPFGITIVADHLSALMLVLTGFVGFAIAIYSLTSVDKVRQSLAYFPLLHLLLMGVSAAFLAGDVFNLYVWFEVFLVSSFVLLALGSTREQLEGAIKYVTINLISSFVFLSAVGMLYGVVGTLNMAHAAVRLAELDHPGLASMLAALFFIAFGIKAAVFPLFFWLPASYHTPPAAISALFAGLLTKVGVYALIRFFTLLFTQHVETTHTLILAVSALTMLAGVLGAMAQHEFRRILSFHIISQIGYMTLGLGLFTPLALAGSVFYIAHHIIVKTNLFLISGIAQALTGSYRLNEMGGLYRRAPWLSLGFAVSAMSLAGIPPLSGFIAKLVLIEAGLKIEQYAVVAVAIVVSLLTLYSMAKIWTAAFWSPRESAVPAAAGEEPMEMPLHPLNARQKWVLGLPVMALALVTVVLGLFPGPLMQIAESAAAELLDPDAYVTAVMGE